MSRITATHADEWNTWGTVKQAAERIANIHKACESQGRDPATLWCSVQALFFLVDDPATAARIADHAPADRSVIGNAEQLAAAFDGYRELGYDEIIIPDFTLGTSPAARREAFERFASDVLTLVD